MEVQGDALALAVDGDDEMVTQDPAQVHDFDKIQDQLGRVSKPVFHFIGEVFQVAARFHIGQLFVDDQALIDIRDVGFGQIGG